LPKTADTTPADGPTAEADELRADLMSALTNLGYQRAGAEKAIDRGLKTSESREFQVVLRAILKDLART